MEEIEILDLDDNNKESNMDNLKIIPTRIENKNKKHKDKKNKEYSYEEKVIYHPLLQNIFCIISGLFVLGCLFYYGQRFIKYYRIYNPKGGDASSVSVIAKNITSSSEIVYEGSGLYHNDGGNYTYKGDVLNNYVYYSNMLWRIIRINTDSTIDLILDEGINVLNWDNKNKSYLDSNIYKYLNDYFANLINKDMLLEVNICTDKVEDLTSISCNDKQKSGYVNLLDIAGFLNSINDGKTYLSNEDIFWLRDYNDEVAWHTNNANISKSEKDNFYEVKPVITLKGTTIRYSGDGTKDNPYIIEKEQKVGVGSKVKLGNDIWTIYNIDKDKYYLELDSLLNKQYRFSLNSNYYSDNDEGSLYEYLNNTYLDELSYKDLIIENEWNIGYYDGDYTSITSKKVKAKVGLLSMIDIKFNKELDNYFLGNGNSDEFIYVYGTILKNSKTAVYHDIRPCICISKNKKISLVENNLYKVEEA